jgi:hypothetical protein
MAIDYNDLAVTAAELISEFGRNVNVKLHSYANVTINPVTGAATGTAVVTDEVAVFSKLKGELVSDTRMVGNSSTIRSTFSLMFRHTTVIAEGDKVECEGYVWNIEAIEKIQPGNVLLATKVTLWR